MIELKFENENNITYKNIITNLSKNILIPILIKNIFPNISIITEIKEDEIFETLQQYIKEKKIKEKNNTCYKIITILENIIFFQESKYSELLKIKLLHKNILNFNIIENIETLEQFINNFK